MNSWLKDNSKHQSTKHTDDSLSIRTVFSPVLFLDVRTQFKDIFFAGSLELVREAEIFDLNLKENRGTSGEIIISG